MEWVEVAVRIHRDAQEAVAAALERAGAGGCSFDDPLLLVQKSQEKGWDYVGELPPLKPGEGERVTVKAYLPRDQRLEARLEEIRGFVRRLPDWGLDSEPGEVVLRPVAEEDWAEAWKAFYHPLEIGRRLVVKPSWEDYHAKGRVVLDLDPGMAFGTGTHPTTALCLELLEEMIRGGEVVLDLGTGSGILAIAAGKLGAGQVLGVDVDPVAVAAARENTRRNGVQKNVIIEEADLLAGEPPFPMEPADLLTANIIAEVIILLAPRLGKWLSPGGRAILGGIIEAKAPEVMGAVERAGLFVERLAKREGWVCLVVRKKEGKR